MPGLTPHPGSSAQILEEPGFHPKHCIRSNSCIILTKIIIIIIIIYNLNAVELEALAITVDSRRARFKSPVPSFATRKMQPAWTGGKDLSLRWVEVQPRPALVPRSICRAMRT